MEDTEKKQGEKQKKTMSVPVAVIAQAGMMVALIEVCKYALLALPNVELTTFWIIMFTIFFGYKVWFVIPTFILVETFMFGFQNWVIMYLYMWPSLAILTFLTRKREDVWHWAILSGAYGLLFGFFCAIPYVVTGLIKGGITAGLSAGFTWWVAGIPYDLIHGIANFVIMLLLYKPVSKVMKKVSYSSTPSSGVTM